MIRYGSIGVNDTGVLYNLDMGVSVCLVKYDMVIVTLCPTKECVGFMADSGMFAMVRGHGISAFPSTILINRVFLRRGKQVKRVSSKR